MSAFLSPLRVQLLEDTSHDGRGTWQLTSDLVYQSDVAGQTFSIPAGFITDYASVPRVPIAYFLVGDTCHKAAVLHDWLYTVHITTKEIADAVLKEAAIASGVPEWRAELVWEGVAVGGRASWDAPATPQPPGILQLPLLGI